LAGTELRRREWSLDQEVHRLGASKARIEARLRELEAAERALISRSQPATGVGGASREHESELARDQVVAESVEPVSEGRYMDLYRASAREYEFGPDRYAKKVLAVAEAYRRLAHDESVGPYMQSTSASQQE